MPAPVQYNFNDSAINLVFSQVLAWAQMSGRFDEVNGHEPKNAPPEPTGITYGQWVQALTPIKASGLSSVSGVVVITTRQYTGFRSQPFDGIDPRILASSAELMARACNNFDFGRNPNVRNVDIFGAWGVKLAAQAGFVELSRTVYRVMTTTVPVILNQMFMEVSGG